MVTLAFVSLHWFRCEAFDDSDRRAALRVFWVVECGWHAVSVSVRETFDPCFPFHSWVFRVINCKVAKMIFYPYLLQTRVATMDLKT